MKLSALLSGLDFRQSVGAADPECAGLAYDSRRVTPGMVFFALPGEKTDGHDHAAEAAAHGAVAVVSQRDCGLPPDVTSVFVDNPRQTLARAAATFYRQPANDLKVIGITGTNGKTTVAFLVRGILNAVGLRTGMIGTVEYDVGSRTTPASRTTPESLELQQLLAQMRDANCAACVMEVSSHALEQNRVEAVDFDLGVFTNLTQDHLDYHGDMETYFASKQKLFQMLGDPLAAVVNLDDDYGSRLMIPGRLSFGFAQDAVVRAVQCELHGDHTRLVAKTHEGEVELLLSCIGRHNVSNALAAFAVARSMGVEPEAIAEAFSALPPPPGRLEAIRCGQSFGVFVDYAHTDDALHHVLTTLRELTPGKLRVMFGCGGNRDAGKRRKMGAAAAALADDVIITNDNPRHEDPVTIAEQVAVGCREARPNDFEIELDRQRAIDEMLRRARPEDIVLLAGKGHETYQEIGDVTQPFDDREQARSVLRAMGYED